jgi:hypothetical protein
MRRAWACLFAGMGATAAVMVSSAAEGAFQATQCGWHAPVPVAIGSTTFDYDPQYLIPTKISNNYLGNTQISIDFYTNNYVQYLIPQNSASFILESGFDFLDVSFPGYDEQITGTHSANSYTDLWDIAGGGKLNFRFIADATYTKPVANYVDSLAPLCSTTATQASNPIGVDQRVDGLLIQTGDVVYFQVQQTADMLISMSALTPGVDFDLYASTVTRFPDDTSYYNGNPGVTDWRGDTSNPNEAFEVSYQSYPYTRTVYIGVHSYAGGGQFTLRAYQPLYGAFRHDVVNVCTPGTTITGGSSDAWKLTQALQETSLRTLVATEGKWMPSPFVVQSTAYCEKNGKYDPFCGDCDSACDICVEPPSDPNFQTAGSPSSVRAPSMDEAFWNNAFSASQVLVHEFAGHQQLGVPDERGGAPPQYDCQPHSNDPNCQDFWTYCGHSMMGDQWQSHTFCTDLFWYDPPENPDHCLDPASPYITNYCANPTPVWTALTSHFVFRNMLSPDPTLLVVKNLSMQAIPYVYFE